MSTIITETHITKVKVYEERINLRRLMHLQQELLEKKRWLKGYNAEPSPYLTDAAKNVQERMDWIEKEMRSTENKLSPETKLLIQK